MRVWTVKQGTIAVIEKDLAIKMEDGKIFIYRKEQTNGQSSISGKTSNYAQG